MADTKSTTNSPKLLPWQMAVMALAVVLILWQIIGYLGEQRALSNVKNNPGDYASKLPAGSVRQQREMEK